MLSQALRRQVRATEIAGLIEEMMMILPHPYKALAVTLLGLTTGTHAQQVYFNNFESAIGPALTLTQGAGALGLDSDSPPANQFPGLVDQLTNGGLDNNQLTLNLTNLPTHTALVVSFDAIILRSMDGGNNCCGPDFFVFTLGSFARTTTFGGPTQMFPNYVQTGGQPTDNAPYTGGTFTGQTGAFFPITFSIPHSTSSVSMSWSMSGLQGVFDEGWSVDNIRVTAVPEPAPFVLLALGSAIVGLLARRRRHGGA